jgi:hypothetical protein
MTTTLERDVDGYQGQTGRKLQSSISVNDRIGREKYSFFVGTGPIDVVMVKAYQTLLVVYN